MECVHSREIIENKYYNMSYFVHVDDGQVCNFENIHYDNVLTLLVRRNKKYMWAIFNFENKVRYIYYNYLSKIKDRSKLKHELIELNSMIKIDGSINEELNQCFGEVIFKNFDVINLEIIDPIKFSGFPEFEMLKLYSDDNKNIFLEDRNKLINRLSEEIKKNNYKKPLIPNPFK